MFIAHLNFLLCAMPVRVGSPFFYWVVLFLLIISRNTLHMMDTKVCELHVLLVSSSIVCLVFSFKDVF